MLSNQFRQLLRREVDSWVQEDLISSETAQQLALRYQFDRLDVESRNTFVVILVCFGSILIGLGLITFISANWQSLGRTWRVLLLMGLFMATNVGGFYLWKSTSERRRRLGQGLLLLGSLILGGNMALMGQTFHVDGESYALFMVWSVGVTLMAYTLRLTSLGILAILLMGIGYWQYQLGGGGNFDGSWFGMWKTHMSILALALFFPLAYICRSPAIFALAGVAGISAFQANLITWHRLDLAIACTIPPLFYWGYGHLSRSWPLTNSGKVDRFPAIAHQLAATSLVLTYFTLSFYEFWEQFKRGDYNQPLAPSPSIDGILWMMVTIAIWGLWLRQERRQLRDFSTTLMVLLGSLAVGGLALIDNGGLASVVAWVLLLIASSLLVRSALVQGDRRAFWFGICAIVLRIGIWFSFTQTDLMLKALFLSLCGVIVIFVGLWFERYVRRFSAVRPH